MSVYNNLVEPVYPFGTPLMYCIVYNRYLHDKNQYMKRQMFLSTQKLRRGADLDMRAQFLTVSLG